MNMFIQFCFQHGCHSCCLCLGGRCEQPMCVCVCVGEMLCLRVVSFFKIKNRGSYFSIAIFKYKKVTIRVQLRISKHVPFG